MTLKTIDLSLIITYLAVGVQGVVGHHMRFSGD